MNDLVVYEKAEAAIDELHQTVMKAESFNSVNGARLSAELLRGLLKKAGNVTLQNKAARIRINAERTIGNMLAESERNLGGQPEKNQSHDGTSTPTLEEMGINKNQSSRWQKTAAVPEEKAEAYFEEAMLSEKEITTSDFMQMTTLPESRAKILTGETEWYTPRKYVEAVREVMGGIDLDPASSDFAQEIVKAQTFYTAEDDGLSKAWVGRVFLNPPYKHPLVERFVQKLINSDTEAVLLTNNATDTGWWHIAASHCSAVCFVKGRISFYQPGGEKNAPTHGQTFFYFGNSGDRFSNIFSKFGLVL